jgi:hypothetical protein
MGRRGLRALVVAALMAAGGGLAGSQPAVAGTSLGVTIPDETFAQNPGDHTIPVTIGSAAVGRLRRAVRRTLTP